MLLGWQLLLLFKTRAILCSKGLPEVYFEVKFCIVGYLPRLWQTSKTALRVSLFRPHRCFLFPHVVAVSHCLIRPSRTVFRRTTKIVVHSQLFCPVQYFRHLWFILRSYKVLRHNSRVSSSHQNKQNGWYKPMVRKEWFLSLNEKLIKK
jgi:hypothetical protein